MPFMARCINDQLKACLNRMCLEPRFSSPPHPFRFKAVGTKAVQGPKGHL